MDDPLQSAQELQKRITPAPEPAPPRPGDAIAGFWRRLGAYLLDWFILGASAYIVGFFLFDTFARLGLWGRVAGFTLGLLYYGILDSSLGGGQTVGKRLLKIKVVDERGEFFSFPWTMIRYGVLFLPYYLGGLLLPAALRQPWLDYVVAFATTGLVWASIYLFIFNRRTRQALHDLAIGSFVVRAETQGAVGARPVWTPHLTLVAFWLVGVLLWLALKTPPAGNRDLLTARQEIEQLDHVRSAAVLPYEIMGSRMLIALAVYDTTPENYDSAVTEIAETLVDACPQRVPELSAIVIQAQYGYDLGMSLCWSQKISKKIYSKNGTNPAMQKEWNKLTKGTDGK